MEVNPCHLNGATLHRAGELLPCFFHAHLDSSILGRDFQGFLFGFPMGRLQMLCQVFVLLCTERALSQSSYLLCKERPWVNNDILIDVKGISEIKPFFLSPFLACPRYAFSGKMKDEQYMRTFKCCVKLLLVLLLTELAL
jgi:hypothetical protein